MARVLFASFVLQFFLLVSASAQGVIVFEEETHNFGEVVEGVQATHEFVFKNTGNAPIVISGVKASCGCTTPYWTKEPVAPGKTGTIKASYNSKGRPGAFHKTITITSNATPPRKMVNIQGTVVKKAKVYSAEEKRLSPKLVLHRNTFDLGTLENGQTATAKVPVSNEGIKDLEISSITSSCRCVDFSLSKPSVAKGEAAVLFLNYSPRGVGNQNEKVTIKSNDINQPDRVVELRANVVESIGKQSIMQQGAKTPFK